MVKTIRQTFLVCIDIFAIYAAYYIAFYIRFDMTLLTSPDVVKFFRSFKSGNGIFNCYQSFYTLHFWHVFKSLATRKYR